jgi:hypothetical protein
MGSKRGRRIDAAGAPALEFDAAENVIFVTHPSPTYLATDGLIRAYFDRVVSFWRATCTERAFFVVDYTNLRSEIALNDFYAEQIRRVIDECAVTIVRHGGEPLQRAMARLVGMRLHIPSRVYGSRDEALAVVRGLRQGTLTIAPPKRRRG